MTVVQAHGAFDLLHLGHIRHLEAAKKLGDVLIVTITADRFINKGPGRPVFSEGARMETLEALSCVDYVAIAEGPDAVSAIDLFRPDIFVKGQDYQNPEGDVTGKIVAEREAVEAYGGCIHFTDEMTLSSSQLINQHFNVYEPHVRSYLDSLRGRLDEILCWFEKIKEHSVVFIGENITDEYHYVVPMGKPPKEHIIAARHQDTEVFAGGVTASAEHLRSFVFSTEIIGGPVNIKKKRFVDATSFRKLFEVSEMDDSPYSNELAKVICDEIKLASRNANLVIVNDFGHGMLVPKVISEINKRFAWRAINAQTNSANVGYNLITRYSDAEYICIDAPEARLALGDRLSPIGDIIYRLATKFPACKKFIITNGKHGCITYSRGGVAHTVPAVARGFVDTMGAGDAFLAITAPLVHAGCPLDLVGFVGNVVGAIKVGIVGHRSSVDKATLIKSIKGLLK